MLARHSGSAKLWRAFLAWRRAQFSQFTCSAMRRTYGDALRVRGRFMSCMLTAAPLHAGSL